MVSPGRRPYRKYKDFWEQRIPESTHSLGNHTWHHKGAKSVAEADREIGSVTHLIRSLYPQRSELMVFASGGGEKWGGKKWSRSDPAFRSLAEKYHLIDLYDGRHPSISCDTSSKIDELCASVEDAIKRGVHQAFHFL